MHDDDPPPRPASLVATPPLDGLGIAELRAYIAALQAEIARAEAMIGRKDSHRGAAESVFRR